MEVFVFVPGVSNKGLYMRVDNDTLLIDGDASLDMPEGMKALYTELRTPHFRRSFALSREPDTARIDAKLKDGVLTVTIPKAEAAKPHRIELRSGS
jgi:HSP20 family molecular chaperone IbpA